MPCPACGCGSESPAHAIVSALRADDLDRALGHGLLEVGPCSECGPECRAMLTAAREERRRALAARERHRARTERLARRAEERKAQRAAAQRQPAALPPAAAAALARALAKASKPR
jgi:hypothetical protein